MMAEVACFCGCLYSFHGGAGACPRCGEHATVMTAAVSASAGPRISAEVARYGFVTGASSGAGEAVACRLAADGWDLTITARRGPRLSALAERLSAKHGVRVRTCVADLTKPGDVADLEQASRS
jgi:shikimate 5-dehydrogenase